MTPTMIKPNLDYHIFTDAHRQGYEDAIAGKPKARHFGCLVRERGYLAGQAMAQLTQELGGYWNQADYWDVWCNGTDDQFHGRPYENPYPLTSWKHLTYLSGVRACMYVCAY